MKNYTSNNMMTGTGPPTVPRTSRRASQPERSVLTVLRALVPRRALEPGQAEYVAELQANRLLELAGRPEPPIPDELIADLRASWSAATSTCRPPAPPTGTTVAG